MESISFYLEKFKNLPPSPAVIQKSVAGAIFECVGVVVLDNIIEVRNGTVFIRATGSLKSELFIKKTEILERINQKLQTKVLEVR